MSDELERRETTYVLVDEDDGDVLTFGELGEG